MLSSEKPSGKLCTIKEPKSESLYASPRLIFLSKYSGMLSAYSLPMVSVSDAAYQKDIKRNKITLKNGTVYTGDLRMGRPHGNGKAVYKNGNVYEGFSLC